jgi:hypothetical protein
VEREEDREVGMGSLMKLHPHMDMTFSEWAAMMIAWPIAWVIGGILIICMRRGRDGKAKR